MDTSDLADELVACNLHSVFPVLERAPCKGGYEKGLSCKRRLAGENGRMREF